jgi:MFS transporter, putative metabolite:H+ symporter
MFIAVPIVAFLAWWLVPLSPYGLNGWRWVVLIGAAASMVIWILRLAVPESPLWLARNGRYLEAIKIVHKLEAATAADSLATPAAEARPSVAIKREGFAELFRPPYLSLVALFMVFNFCQAFGFYGFANWVPTLLVEKGITVTKSLQYSFIVAFAYRSLRSLPPVLPTASSANGSSAGPARRSSSSASPSPSSSSPCC